AVRRGIWNSSARILLRKEWKEPRQFGLVGAAAVFADFECLGVFHLGCAVFAVPLFQTCPVVVGKGLVAPGEAVADLLVPLFLLFGIGGQQVSGAVGAAFCELRHDRAERVEFFLNG